MFDKVFKSLTIFKLNIFLKSAVIQLSLIIEIQAFI